MIFLTKITSLITVLLFSSFAYSESPPEVVSPYPYTANINSVNIDTLKQTECKGSLISPSWVLTHLKCIKGKNNDTTVSFIGSNNYAHVDKVINVFKFKNKKFALLQLANPVENIQPVKLLRYPLLPQHDGFTATIVQSSFNGEKDLIKGINRNKLSHRTELPQLVRESKGGPWVIETQTLGDVQIGFSLNNKTFAMQTSRLAKAIERITSTHSGESVEWVDRQVLLDTINCEKDGTCIELPECPDGVQDCGLDPCELAGNCVIPPTECPDDVQDCGLEPCVLAGNCVIPPTECPDGVQDCGLEPCELAGNCVIPPTECPDGVQDCGLEPCELADNCVIPPTECPDGVQDCGLEPCELADNCVIPFPELTSQSNNIIKQIVTLNYLHLIS
ncbi:trypsin-like serine protease [Photobacterium phosphoreum]|uniref:trypsin-like serine protease n=1 Tax=Photobacterium phosphoreum TaxID=659 RepID=UPI0015E668C6|nr:trypsin-like serine protease [Photobacterium phosphoreum]